MALGNLPSPRDLSVPSLPRPGRAVTGALLGVAAALGVTALWNYAQARRAEREHPPLGRFVEVDGVRLHYVDRGQGRPVVLLHGNMMLVEDWALSGVLDMAAARHRVLAFDRPGYGRSERTRDRVWTPAAQADLLHEALQRLGVERPIVVGHSFGTLVALELALRHPEDVAGLTLVSGYYVPTARADVPLLSPPALPVVGDVMRHTLSPLLLRLSWPALTRVLFGPAPTPPAFNQLEGLVSRPEPIRASASESALLVPSAVGLAERAEGLRVPVAIVAGSDDRFVGTQEQSHALHHRLAGSDYREVPGAGHMVHHTAPQVVVDAIDLVARRVEEGRARAA
jgi:pimeloyl-ACP methyl ester carboxylesterase